MNEKEGIDFKSYYIAVFSSNYFFQGVTSSVFAVIIPIYLIQIVGGITASEIAFIASIILIPWILKVFFAILSDRYGTKKLGRRKPYVLIPMIFAGLIWLILSAPNIANSDNIIFVFVTAGVLINLGIAIADTALDGLIIDICPKKQLGRTQGFCWGLNSVGAIIGGPMLAFLLVSIKAITVQIVFIIVGISMIATSLFILFIKEKDVFHEVMIKDHLKEMFNNKRDWLGYFYSMLRSLYDGVIVLLISIIVLIKIGVLKSEGVTLSIEGSDMNVYLYQANVSIIISIGIIVGALIGGQIADLKSRKLSVFFSILITLTSLILLILEYSFIPLLLFIASLSGVALGWRRAVAAAVIGELSKKHPEMDSTHFSISMAFANIGAIIGLLFTGIILNLTQDYSISFIYLAFTSLLVLIPFMLLKPKDYELRFIDK